MKWLVEQWFRVSARVRVRARAREYSSSFFFLLVLFRSFFCLIPALNKPYSGPK